MFENAKTRTELSSLGEFGLIEYIKNQVNIKNTGTIKGIGDDAAVLSPQPLNRLLCTDLLVEGVHFDLSYTPLKHLGYKAVVVNLSDIYAMNGRPDSILVSLALSNRISLEAVEEIYSGILTACEEYGVDLIGGDTSGSSSGLFISVTASGWVEPQKVVYRSGAQEKDLICVSGDLGAAYMGLQLLNREKKIFLENPGAQPDLGNYDYLLERQLKPEARRDIIEKFKQWEIQPNAMMDISDGLASDLIHICRASHKGCMLFEEKIPIDHQTRELGIEFGLDPTIAALNGGEDYELLFTLSLAEYEKIKERSEVSIIGYITAPEEGYRMTDRQNHLHELKAQGWQAFQKPEAD